MNCILVKTVFCAMLYLTLFESYLEIRSSYSQPVLKESMIKGSTCKTFIPKCTEMYT